MSRFYGTLTERLSLLAVDQTETNKVSVRYHYVGPSGTCDGQAILTLRQLGNDHLIESISAQGC